MRWLDCSAYTEELSPSFIDAAKANGIEGLAVQLYGGTPSGTGLNPSRHQQLDIALNAGLDVAGYSWPSVWASYAVHQTLGYPYRFIGLDVEAGAGVARSHVDAIRNVGLDPWVYASSSTWAEIMGFSTAFTDCKLWDARYPLRDWSGHWYTPAESAALFVPYGGWSSRAIWQFAGTTTLRDDQFDLNVADLVPAGGDDMATNAELEAALAQMKDVNRIQSEQIAGALEANRIQSRQIESALEGNRLAAEINRIQSAQIQKVLASPSGVPPHPHTVTVTLDS